MRYSQLFEEDTQITAGFWRPKSMPVAAGEAMLTWATVFKSPFGNSFYSMPGKTWTHTPEGCLRIADHWNFTNKKHGGKRFIHCPTDKEVPMGTWAMGRWEGGAEGHFVVVAVFGRVGRSHSSWFSLDGSPKPEVNADHEWRKTIDNW